MKLHGNKIKDIHLISCLIQDSITTLEWMNQGKKIFDLFLNRFCWEDKATNHEKLRTNSILYISNIKNIFVKNPPKQKNLFRTLLACLCESKNTMRLVFDENFEILLEGKNLSVELEDVTDKWPTAIIPFHSMVE